MQIRDIFVISKGTRVVFGITLSVAFASLLFAFFYYRSINRSEDPRTRKAREYLAEYDQVAGNPDQEGFCFLDSAHAIFKRYKDYERSFETGLIYNNKCSSLLMTALYDSSLSRERKDNLLLLAMNYCDTSITIYQEWMNEWGGLSSGEITSRLSSIMSSQDPSFQGMNFKKIFDRRLGNIRKAQLETPRRLSVSFTNKGTILRHLMKQDSALHYYRKALDLWEHNRTAESNLNVLMGGEPLKPGLIESLFPPDRNKN